MADWQRTIDGYIDELAQGLVAIRRGLHSHPELSGMEFETTRYLAERLRAHRLEPEIPDTGRGILVDGGDPGAPRIAMRGDMDALPLQDEKDVSYRSTREGVTHACGHDAHATMLLAATLTLHACAEQLPWPLAWRGIFQPAEETTEGAAEMIGAGAMEGVDAIIALHVDPERVLGQIGVRYGHLTATCEELEVVVHGTGGHAARPHHTQDAIAIATQFVNAVYQFIPRSVDSRDPVVVTFGMIQGGANANVIPERVRLMGTIRTMGGTTSSRVRERILAIAHGLSEASQAHVSVRFSAGARSVINDPAVTSACAAAAEALVGPSMIEQIELPSMGAEDFSDFLEQAPGCMLRLGTRSGPETAHFLHSPHFDLDERALALGTKLLVHAALELANPKRRA